MKKVYVTRLLVGFLFLFGCFITITSAEEPEVEINESLYSPKTIGNPDATVKIIEYSSFTCPHCASFHLETLPQLKSDYIDKGLVALEYREVYFDGPGLWAGLLARCKGVEKYFPMVDLIFKKQKEWTSGGNESVVEGLKSLGRQAGLSNEESLECMQNDNLAKKLVEIFKTNAGQDSITSTPSFVINGKLVPNSSYKDIKEIIDSLLD